MLDVLDPMEGSKRAKTYLKMLTHTKLASNMMVLFGLIWVRSEGQGLLEVTQGVWGEVRLTKKAFSVIGKLRSDQKDVSGQ